MQGIIRTHDAMGREVTQLINLLDWLADYTQRQQTLEIERFSIDHEPVGEDELEYARRIA